MLGIQEDLEDKTGEENNQNAFYSPMKLLKNNNEIIIIIIIKELCQNNRGEKREIKIYQKKGSIC